MKLANVTQIRDIDRLTIEKYNIPGYILMENAGFAAACEILSDIDARKFVVVCGKGNNGGDGSVVARHLFANGKDVTAMLLCDPNELKGDARSAFNMALDIGVKFVIGIDHEILKECDAIVDAVLGVGALNAPHGEAEKAIEAINFSGKPVYSIDVPSGINCDTGAVEGVAVKANVTITFGVNKIGLVCYPGRLHAGRVVIKNIGFAPQAIDKQNINVHTIEDIKMLPVADDAHKGTCGKAFVVAGSTGYTGAAYLNSLSAMRAGCGLVTLAIPRSLNSIMEQKLTEVITLPVEENNGVLSSRAKSEILDASKSYNSIICGSGLTNCEDVKTIITSLITSSKAPMVIDADGINVLQKNTNILKNKSCSIILTPHVVEMARLAGLTAEQVKNNTVAVAQSFAREYNITIVLKSAHTVIAAADGRTYINTFGNSGMATAGSGDVLAGIIGSYLAQGAQVFDAAVRGVYIHAKAGDLAEKQLGRRAMLATDILENISQVERMLYV